MKNYFSLIFVFTFVLSSYCQGLKLAPKDRLQTLETFTIDEFGFSTSLPSSYSLEKYVPTVLDQGDSGACVGYSVVYYALSTMYNVELNITDNQEKLAFSFDPMFIYSLMNTKTHCNDGLYIDEALEKLMINGAKKIFMEPLYVSCNKDWTLSDLKNVKSYSRPFAISNAHEINVEDGINTINEVKYLIKNNKPVVIGLRLPSSFDKISSTGLWWDTKSETTDSNDGHAMCIVGYDDIKYGGAFRVVNSWGDDFGDNGYVWMKYKDFYYYSYKAYTFSIAENLFPFKNEQIKEGPFVRKVFGNGDIYEGEVSNDMFNGKGILKKDGEIFIGKFRDNKPNGDFIMIYENDIYFPTYDYFGNLIEMKDEYGFATEVSKEQAKKEEYFNLMIPKLELKTSKSARKN